MSGRHQELGGQCRGSSETLLQRRSQLPGRREIRGASSTPKSHPAKRRHAKTRSCPRKRQSVVSPSGWLDTHTEVTPPQSKHRQCIKDTLMRWKLTPPPNHRPAAKLAFFWGALQGGPSPGSLGWRWGEASAVRADRQRAQLGCGERPGSRLRNICMCVQGPLGEGANQMSSSSGHPHLGPGDNRSMLRSPSQIQARGSTLKKADSYHVEERNLPEMQLAGSLLEKEQPSP